MHQFLTALLRAEGSHGSPSEVTSAARHHFLREGSETPDNLAAVELVEYGPTPLGTAGSQRVIHGLKLAGSDVLLSDVLNTIEGTAVPTEIGDRFPDLSQDQWDAALRWVTMILVGLERMDESETSAVEDPAP